MELLVDNCNLEKDVSIQKIDGYSFFYKVGYGGFFIYVISEKFDYNFRFLVQIVERVIRNVKKLIEDVKKGLKKSYMQWYGFSDSQNYFVD